MSTKLVPSYKSCLTCGKDFYGLPSKLYCKKACRASNVQRRLLTPTWTTSLTKPTLGAIGELAVCQDLMQKGYAVFRAISPSCYCDLLAQKSTTVWHIEVRTGYARNGRMYCARKYQDGVNCLAVWDKETNAVSYYIPDTLLPLVL